MGWREGIGFGDPKNRRTVAESQGDTALWIARLVATAVILLGLVVQSMPLRVVVLSVAGAGFIAAIALLRSRRPTVKRPVAYSVIAACLGMAVLTYIVEIL